MTVSLEITRRAKSNLAFALQTLPRQRRRDMRVFYAFCRTIDDLADDDQRLIEERAERLMLWNQGFIHGFKDPDPLQREVVEMVERLEVPHDLLLGIIEGCLLDLYINRIPNWEELEKYIWKVSCTVGLVSVHIFGCRAMETKTYAIELAKALQLTNIIRDIQEDLEQRNRIYLPLHDLNQFGYSEEDLLNRVYDDRFLLLMNYQARRAQDCFDEAALNLTAQDRRALRPAQVMSDIYQDLLNRMRKDNFQVFDKRYRVGTAWKVFYLFKHLMG